MTSNLNDPASAAVEYDVSNSFQASDVSLVGDVVDCLSDASLRVFFFPRTQEELVETSGTESMRAPFQKSRVQVVFYLDRLGQTKWTGLEDHAVRDACLNSKYRGLIFVTSDLPSSNPNWLPETQVRFDWREYGREQLIGVSRADQRVEGGRTHAARTATCEQPVFSSKSHGPDGVFGGIVAALEPSVVELTFERSSNVNKKNACRRRNQL